MLRKLILPYIIASALLAGCAKHEVLTVAGFGGVLDSALMAQFEDEYYKATGITVDVQFSEYEEYELVRQAEGGRLFDLMLTTNSSTPAFIDLGVLRPLNHARIRPLDDYLPYMLNYPSDVGNRYTVPYSYLVMGILYDASRLSEEAAGSVQALWSQEYAGHIGMQSLELILFGTASAYLHRDKLSRLSKGYTTFTQAYRDSLQQWITLCTPENAAAVKRALLEQYPRVGMYDTGSKLSAYMNSGEGWIAWVRHPLAVQSMFRNHKLNFVYCREGAAYCPFLLSMTTACVKVDLAYAFLKFLQRTDVAVRNMYEHFMPGVTAEAVEQCRSIVLADTVHFAGTTREWRSNFFDMYNMSADVAKRTPLLLPLVPDEIRILSATIREFWETIENGE